MTSGCGVLEVHKDQETDALASRPSPASQQLCDFKSVTEPLCAKMGKKKKYCPQQEVLTSKRMSGEALSEPHGTQNGTHVLLQALRRRESLSRVRLCNPTDCSPPGSSVHGILQARTLEWVAIPFSRGSSQPRDRTQVSCIVSRFFIV